MADRAWGVIVALFVHFSFDQMDGEVLVYVLGGTLSVVIALRLVSARFYDAIIVHMTELWYKVVLERVEESSNILDIGIGTATALLMNKDLVEKKKLTVVGVDYDQSYINAATKSVAVAGLQERIRLHCKSVFDEDLASVVKQQGMEFDSVYFSGSWSLMPSPVQAVRVAAKLCKDDGLIYITQTFQKQASPIMKRVKPLLKYITTIDFGNLHLVSDLDQYLKETEQEQDGVRFTVLEKQVIPGSIDNMFQAAYLIVLKKTVVK